ncbi:MAG: hypothetical protein U0871_22780 [Gemmataceae bacterium]
MSYRITWSTTAFGQMGAILTANPAQQGDLATALRRVADDLGHNPFGVGESREKDRRSRFSARSPSPTG